MKRKNTWALAGMIVWVLSLIVGYLMISFMTWDINPTHWGWFGRGVYLVYAVLLTIAAYKTYDRMN